MNVALRQLSRSSYMPTLPTGVQPSVRKSQASTTELQVDRCELNVAVKANDISEASNIYVPQHFDKNELQKCYLSEDGNQLSAVGKALYSKIADAFLSSVPQPAGAPTLTMTGGLPGSGKGQLVKMMQQEVPPFVVVDADKLKDWVLLDLLDKNPNLRSEMEQCKEWASVSHRVSRVLAHELIVDSVAAGKDCLFDSTLAAPKREEYREFVAQARSKGYLVQAKLAQVELETAVQRAEARAQQPYKIGAGESQVILGGRYVPSELIRGAYEGLVTNREAFIQEGLFDRLQIFDNNQTGKPMTLQQEYQRVCLADGFCTSQPVLT